MSSLTPVTVVDLTDVEELAVGSFHACVRLRDGTVMCWGDNQAGAIGDGTMTSRPRPIVISIPGAP